jgi:hypothetical protein
LSSLSGDQTRGLAALWDWLASWIAPDGGVNGPVVHRLDLKRMFAIHDTPWTQEAVIRGLLDLYRRSGRDYWLNWAIRLGDAQCARQRDDGAFRWAGHEDDRFSSLIHNALADCALLELAAVLTTRDDAPRRARYVAAAEMNLEQYLIGKLYRSALRGFAMNPIDYYAGRDRFVVNMNCVAIEALFKLDRERGVDVHAPLVRTVAERIQALQTRDGPCAGGVPYSNLEPETHISIYTALTLRALPALVAAGQTSAGELARGTVAFLKRLEDAETGLWCHRISGGQLHRFPIFVAGAGIIGNALLDSADLTEHAFDAQTIAGRLLRFQHRHGGIRNFIGYDDPDNGRPRGRAVECWEDVYPTPNWNAHAFRLLCRVVRPPEPPIAPAVRRAHVLSRRFVYLETRTSSAVVGVWPPRSAVVAVYRKRLRHGFVVPGPHAIRRAAAHIVAKLGRGRRAE